MADERPLAGGESKRVITLLLAAAIALGVGLRLKHYFARNAYWHDEASLVLNIFEKSAAQLLGPLDLAQAAAPGFLLLERGVHVLLGRSELAMRLPPLLASMAGIALFALLAWRPARRARDAARGAAAGRPLGVLGTAHLARGGGEAVQRRRARLAHAARRSRCARRARRRSGSSRARRSRPSPSGSRTRRRSCSAAISLALLAAMWRTKRGLLAWLACNALFGASFVALYFLSVRNQQVNALYEYWAAGFVDFSRPWMLPIWFVRAVAEHLQLPARHRRAGAAAADGRRRIRPLAARPGDPHGREVLAMLIMPAALVLVASAIRQYPFTGSRLTLFLAPNVFLLAGFGVAALIEWARRAPTMRAWLAVAVPAYLLAVAAWHAVVYLVRPPQYGNMPAAVRYVAAHDCAGRRLLREQDLRVPLLLARRDASAMRKSSPAKSRTDGSGSCCRTCRAGAIAWSKPLLAEVNPEAQQLDAFSVPGGAAMLFDGIDGPTTRPAAAAAD